MTIEIGIPAARALMGGVLALGLLFPSYHPLPAQGGDVPSPVLPKGDIKTLNKKLAAWFKLKTEANDLDNSLDDLKSDRQRKKLRKKIRDLNSKARKAREKFMTDFEKKGQKVGGLLKHVGDLRAIFEGCFPYKNVFSDGKPKKRWAEIRGKKKSNPFFLRSPKAYKATKDWPLILTLPGKENGKYPSGEKIIEKLWPSDVGDLGSNYLVAAPELDPEIDFNAPFNPSTQKEEEIARESLRRRTIHRILRDIFINFRVDMDRVYMVALGDFAPFALRLVSTFPDRYAGLILIRPSSFEEARISNLSNLAVAVIHDENGKAEAEGFASALEKAGGKVALFSATKKGPGGGRTEDLVSWMEENRRVLFRNRVVLEPVTDYFRKSYWVEILEASYISEVPKDEKPRVEVTADPATNRIVVKARNVTKIRIYYNDLLANLDKEITLVLNGTTKLDKRIRSFTTLQNLVITRGDPRNIFTAMGVYSIPKPEESAGAEEDSGKGSGG